MDENIAPQLAQALEILQESLNVRNQTDIHVKSIKTVFGKGAKDEDWIPKAGEEKACVITKDINIRRKQHQWALCKKYGVGMIFTMSTSKKKGLGHWEFIKFIINHWEDIISIVDEPKPFAYELKPRGGLKRLPT